MGTCPSPRPAPRRPCRVTLCLGSAASFSAGARFRQPGDRRSRPALAGSCLPDRGGRILAKRPVAAGTDPQPPPGPSALGRCCEGDSDPCCRHGSPRAHRALPVQACAFEKWPNSPEPSWEAGRRVGPGLLREAPWRVRSRVPGPAPRRFGCALGSPARGEAACPASRAGGHEAGRPGQPV